MLLGQGSSVWVFLLRLSCRKIPPEDSKINITESIDLRGSVDGAPSKKRKYQQTTLTTIDLTTDEGVVTTTPFPKPKTETITDTI